MKKIILLTLVFFFISSAYAGIYNETTMPRNTAETNFYVVMYVLIIIIAYLLLIALKEGISSLINWSK